MSRDDRCESITRTAEHFQDTFYMGCDEALEHAVLKRRFLIRDILAASAKEAENSMDDYASDNCMGSSDSSDGSDRGFDIWNVTNNKMDNENVSGDARTKRSLDLVLRCMRLVIAWCHDNIYKAIMITLKKAQVSKHMSFHKALKYAIHQNRYKIRKKLIEHDDDNESESDDDDKSECENDDSDETEYDNDDGNDESKSKSENNDVDKVSGSYNMFVDYYVNQARTSKTNPAEKICPYCALRYSEKTCPNCGRP